MAKCKRLSKTNRTFWKHKIETNIARDKRVLRALRYRGWKVLRIKEHELRASLPKTIGKIKRLISAEKLSGNAFISTIQF